MFITEKIENIFIFLCTLFSCVFFLLFNTHSSHLDLVNKDESLSLAKLVYKNNLVKFKDSNSITWRNMNKDHLFFEGDKLITQDFSTASIQFKDGFGIDVAANSIIKITKQEGDATTLKVEAGIITAKTNNSNKFLRLELQNNQFLTIDGKNSEFHINTVEGKTEIAIIKGNAKISDGKSEYTIDSGKVLEIKLDKIEKTNTLTLKNKPIKLISPVLKQVIYKDSNSEQYLQWDDSSNREIYKVHLDKESHFPNSKFLYSKSNQLPVNSIEPGIYYWKVSDKSEKEISNTYWFDLRSVVAPLKTSPQDKARFLLKDKDVYMSWDAKQNESYQVEIKLPTGKIEVVTQGLNHIFYEPKLAGLYEWRVRKSIKELSNTPWSNWSTYKVIKKNEIMFDKPELVIAVPKVKVIETNLNFVDIHIKQNKNISHLFKVLNDKDKVIYQKIIKENEFKWEVLRPGNFKLVLSPFNEILKEGYDLKLPINIQVSPPTLDFPPKNYTVNLHNFEKIEFKWKRSEKFSYHKKYILQIATDIEFASIINEKIIEESYFVWGSLQVGKYYWRVKIIDEDSRDITSFTKVSAFNILEKKQIDIPRDFFIETNEKKVRSKKKKKKSLKGRILARKKAKRKIIKEKIIEEEEEEEERVLETRIKWPKISQAKLYVIEFYRDKDLKKFVKQIKTKENSLALESFSGEEYYFRVAIMNFKNQMGEYSPLSRLMIDKVSKEIITDIKVKRKEELKQLRTPFADKIFKAQKVIPFMWRSIKGTIYYELELAIDPKFESKIFNKKIKETYLVFETNSIDIQGDVIVYWRVKNHFKKKGLFKYSETQKLLVQNNSPHKVQEKFDAILKTAQFGLGFATQSFAQAGSLGGIKNNNKLILSQLISYSKTWEDYGIDFDYESKNIEISATQGGTKISESISSYAYDLDFRYNRYFAGLFYEENAIFRVLPADIQYSKLKTHSLFFGYDIYSIRAPYEIIINLIGRVFMPIKASFDQSGSSIDSVSGSGFLLQLSIDKNINFLFKEYDVYAGVEFEVQQYNKTFSGSWDTSVGEFTTDVTDYRVFFTINLHRILSELHKNVLE